MDAGIRGLESVLLSEITYIVTFTVPEDVNVDAEIAPVNAGLFSKPRIQISVLLILKKLELRSRIEEEHDLPPQS